MRLAFAHDLLPVVLHTGSSLPALPKINPALPANLGYQKRQAFGGVWLKPANTGPMGEFSGFGDVERIHFGGFDWASNSVLRPLSAVVPNQNAMTTPQAVVRLPSISSMACESLTCITPVMRPISMAK